MKDRHILYVGVTALLLNAVPAYAQSAATGPQDEGATLSDIVVTAQRKAERLQDVPISVNAATSEQLLERGITELNTTTFSALVPALTGNFNNGRGGFFLRGVGNSNLLINNEQSVALYVDGAYIAATSGNVLELSNIERVEVLKGPQGTLFGRNSTGGVIQVITKDPSLDGMTFNGSIGYANYRTVKAAAYASAPLSGNLAMDVAFLYKSRDRGTHYNGLLNRDTGDYDNYDIRSKILFEPSDRTQIRLSGDFSRIRTGEGETRRVNGTLKLSGQPVEQVGFRDYYTNTPPRNFFKKYGGLLRIDHDLDFAKFTSLTAYRGTKGNTDNDADSGSDLHTRSVFDLRQRNWQQEFQLASPAGSKLDWLLGVFLYDSHASVNPGIVTGTVAGPSGILSSRGFQSTKSGSVYGQATYELIENLKLTAGLRFTTERSKIRGVRNLGTVNPTTPTVPGKIGFDKPTWRLALDYDFTDRVHGYVSYNRGIKTGGFNILNPSITTAYAPETIDAYEVGLKSELFDRTVRFNIAGFYYNYKDIQTQQTNGQVIVFVNAAKATIKGIDADFEIAPTRQLRINGGFVLLDSKYKSFPGAVAYTAQGGAAFTYDAKGQRLPFASPLAASLGATYTIPSSVGEFSVSAIATYNDGFDLVSSGPKNRPDLRVFNDNYTLVNGRVAWTSLDETFDLEFWANNLTNKDYLAGGFGAGQGQLIIPADPRTYGVTARVKF